MRGRSLLGESPRSSICAFCANRLSPPSHIQRRFLQNTKPTSNASSTAQALKFVVEEPTTSSEKTPPEAAKSSIRGGNGTASIRSAAFKRPAFGRANSLIATDILLGTDGESTELTAEERSTREAIRQRALAKEERRINAQQRPVMIFAGPGPQSSRAGRPIPHPNRNDSPSLTRRHGNEVEDERQPRGREDAYPLRSAGVIRRISGNTVTSSVPPMSTPRGLKADGEALSTWNQLRRRPEQSERILKSVDSIEQSGKKREQLQTEVSYRGFTSLSNKPPVGDSGNPAAREESNYSPRSTESSASQEDRGKSVYRPRTFGLPGRVSEQLSSNRENDTSQSGHQTKNTFSGRDQGYSGRDGQSSRYQHRGRAEPLLESRTPLKKDLLDNSSRNQNFQEVRRENSQQSVNPNLECAEQANQRTTNYSNEESSRSRRVADLPRGRDRDKAKRRSQFTDTNEEDVEDQNAKARAELKKQRKREKELQKANAPIPIVLPAYISVANLAAVLKVRHDDFAEKMTELGFTDTGSDYVLNGENAGLIAQEYNFNPIIDNGDSEDMKARPAHENPSTLPPRPPVVTIMGHVDHGKTTILDWLRKSSVAATEHGGITQHIGAFSVPMPSGKIITFLDTPGHAAFLSMRQRGANVTDIVILVVAADDSVKPQTIEAINHAKAAKVPIIVAINKIDKEDSNIERVKQDLARNGVDVEDFGGDTQVVCVSGKTGQGMEELEEAAVTLSEVLDMRAEKDGLAEGWVLEASVKTMGKVATVLVRRGTVRPGDFIIAGKTWSRIRCLRNEAGVEISEAGPGTPVEIDNWNEQPLAGDEVLQAPTEQKAKSVVHYRLEKSELDRLAEDMDAINEDRKALQEKRDREKKDAAAAALGDEESPVENEKVSKGPKQVYFIVKGDVSGSVEAVIDSVSAIGNQEVQPNILRSGVGQLSEFDVEHAAAAKGFLINFNTTVDANISNLAEASKVSILDHNIIYRLVDDVKAKMSEFLPPLLIHRVLGEAEVMQVFNITVKGRKQKPVAGCKIKNGIVSKTAKVRVMRNGEKIFDGLLESLKNVKKDVTEMRKGNECGIGFIDWNEFQVGDQIQSYETKEEKRYV